MSLKVILINPPSDCVDDDHLEPPLGLLYIASALRGNGIGVMVYDMTGSSSQVEINEKVDAIPEGDIYGITCYCTNYHYVKDCIRHIRSFFSKSFIVLGGPNPSAIPEYTLEDSRCDCVITGEGEDAFLHVVGLHEDGLQIPPIIEGKGRDIIDTYATPAWDLVDIHHYSRVLNGGKTASVISSRGCSHKCAHCNSTVMGSGKKPRFRSPENLAGEIEYLKSMGFGCFRFNDDNFTGNPDLKPLLTVIKALNVRYRIFGRLEELTPDNCRLLAESGCLHISVGIESLNPDNLRILGKYDQYGHEKNLFNARECGMIIRAFFIVGLPYDTRENIDYYFNAAARLPFDEFSIYPLIPYPGTRICRNPAKYGYEIIDRDFTHYVQIGRNKSTAFALRHKNFSEDDIREWHDEAEKIFLAAGKRLQAQSEIAL